MRVIMFHPEVDTPRVYRTYKKTKAAIEDPTIDFVETLQMCFLNFNLLNWGFDYIIISYEDPYDNIIIHADEARNIHCPNYPQLNIHDDLLELWERGQFVHFSLDG